MPDRGGEGSAPPLLSADRAQGLSEEEEAARGVSSRRPLSETVNYNRTSSERTASLAALFLPMGVLRSPFLIRIAWNSIAARRALRMVSR
ncbi:hypothetical protein MTO96_014865 [Rhipicephalus appendiculatus]